ncbi:MAG: hypothetical protein ABIR66_01730 [Saprospiraceae bacterium]
MNRFLPYYYLLFVLLITGAFASMAQNDYGQYILGGTTVAFTLIFVIQWASAMNYPKMKWTEIAELSCLVMISVIMAMRIFYFYFKGIELIFILISGILLLIYGNRIIQIMSSQTFHNSRLKSLILIFYFSLFSYILSLALVQLFPLVSLSAGYLAFGLIVLFIIGSSLSKEFLVDGEKVSAFNIVSRFEDKSILLIFLFLIFSFYTGFTNIGFLPKMYSNEYPQAYYKLLNTAANNSISANELKKKQEEFKVKYEAFIKKHLANE